MQLHESGFVQHAGVGAFWHGKVFEIIKKQNLDQRDRRIITNLYWQQKVNTTADEEVPDEIQT